MKRLCYIAKGEKHKQKTKQNKKQINHSYTAVVENQKIAEHCESTDYPEKKIKEKLIIKNQPWQS